MANQDAPFGFRQVGGLGSRPTSEGTSKYVIQSGTTGAIYAGDVMTAGNGTTISEGGGVLAYGYVGSSETDAVRNVGIFNGCLRRSNYFKTNVQKLLARGCRYDKSRGWCDSVCV